MAVNLAPARGRKGAWQRNAGFLLNAEKGLAADVGTGLRLKGCLGGARLQNFSLISRTKAAEIGFCLDANRTWLRKLGPA